MGPIHVQRIYDQQASEESLQNEGERPKQPNIKKDTGRSRGNEQCRRKKKKEYPEMAKKKILCNGAGGKRKRWTIEKKKR